MDQPEYNFKKITLERRNDSIILVTDDKTHSSESKFEGIANEGYQFLVALADFFGYEPANILNIDDE